MSIKIFPRYAYIVFLNNPVVSLGTIRPGSTHTIEIPIQSRTNKSITLSGTEVSNPNSKPGKVQVLDTRLASKSQDNLVIHYRAGNGSGKSVTHVRYTSPEYLDWELPVYLCAEIEQPVELSPVMLDFGYIPLGAASEFKEVTLKSPDVSTIISRVTADDGNIKEIVVAEDKKSFRFAVFSDEVETFSTQLTVEVLLKDTAETFMRTVRCTGQFQKVIIASPPQVSVVMGNQPRKYTIGIRHIAGKSIKLTSVSSGDAIRYNVPLGKYSSEQLIELTILPEILKTNTEEVKIIGTVENGEYFTETIPVSAFSTLQNKTETSQ
jgi:hypothetical protein